MPKLESIVKLMQFKSMKYGFLNATLFSYFLFSFSFLPAARAVTLSTQDVISQARWNFQSKKGNPTKEPIRSLFEMKRAAASQKWDACIKFSLSAASKAKILGPWILSQRLDCLKDIKSNGGALDSSIRMAESNPDWLLSGPYSAKIKSQLVEAYLIRLEQLAKKDRQMAEQLLDRAMDRQDWMNQTQKARLFRIAGELNFVRQRLKVAESYFRRSLSEKESDEVRERIRSVLSLLKEKPKEQETNPEGSLQNLDASPQERELAERMAGALKSGDLVSAVEDGIEIISDYPGGQRSKWATDRIYDVYASVAAKSDEQYISLKKRILKEMESVDGLRLQNWIEKAFRQGFYEDVMQLSSSALTKLRGTTVSTKTLSLAAHSATYTGDDSRARSLFLELLKEHAGTPESVYALFRLGLMDYRKKDYISAASNFERLLVYPESDKFELNAKYWLWRSLQQTDLDKAKKVAQDLADEFPLTYYGLRAQSELNDGKIDLPLKEIKITEEWHLTSGEERAWQRLKLLLAAGWTDEAQAELGSLSEPTSPNGRILLARYWAAAFDYPTAIRTINKAWDDDPDLIGKPFIKVAFPFEFKDLIESFSKNNSLESNLIRGLIRQESSFFPEALSPTGAKGLMQLMPAAADDMATDLGLKKKNSTVDLFEPNTNVRLGTRYLQRMIRKFDGNISLALAAYNVGPERMSRWMRARKLIPQVSSQADYEIWIDELPWSETSYYVKSVLRNLIIYRVLDKGRVQLGNPIWVTDAG